MTDRVFLVTGAADGVGLQLVARLAAAGRRVLATDLDNHRLEEAARLAAWPADLVRLAPLDVRQPRAWGDAFALARRAFGGLDVVVHAAALPRAAGRQDPAADCGTACALQAAAERMLPRGGQVVVIAPDEALHAGVRARCLSADAELRPKGIAVTAVCTGAVEALENGLALRAATTCPVRGARVSAERVVDAVLGPVLEDRPRQLFLPIWTGWVTRLAELVPALGTRLRSREPALPQATSARAGTAPPHGA